MAGKPMSVAAALQEGLPKMPQAKGIVTKNRFEMLSRDRSESGVRYRYDSPNKRQREESPAQVDKNAAFTSMAGEEEKLVKAKNLVTRIKSKIEQAKEQKMSGLLWDIVYDMACRKPPLMWWWTRITRFPPLGNQGGTGVSSTRRRSLRWTRRRRRRPSR